MAVDLPVLDIEHLHGPEEIPYAQDELVVVCLVRDGRPWINSFVELYFALGVKHIVFLDNDSSDGTVSEARRYDNVTVFRTTLPFAAFGFKTQVLMRQYLIRRFGKDRWCLCVDIDELFDYPYSEVIGLGSLLGYLNSKSYTAVTAHMLDMFPERPLSEGGGEPEELSREMHRFYDISKLRRIRREDYKHFPKSRQVIRNNDLESDEIECFQGGIRQTLFSVAPWLTKYPLVFSGGKLIPLLPHGVSNARIADISCVLFHYKFLEHFREQTARAVREENYWSKSAEYNRYLEVLERNPTLQLKQETSKEIASVNDLLEERFVVVSDDYVRWVNAEEERSVLGRTPGGDEPSELAEAFVKVRQQERAKRLRIQRLERQLDERGRRIGRSKRDQRRLRRRIGRLEKQLEEMRASRVWKVAGVLGAIKARVRGLGRRSS